MNRNVPLRRVVPLRQGAPLQSRTPMVARVPLARRPRESAQVKSAPARRAALGQGRGTGPDRRTRQAVYKRDGYACVCCGTPVEGRPHSVGHRKRRSQGGGNQMSNLLTFLGLGVNPLDPDDHHARIDSRKDPHDEAKGYTVRSHKDPAQVSVMVFSEGGSGVSLYPHDDGTWREWPQEAAA